MRLPTLSFEMNEKHRLAQRAAQQGALKRGVLPQGCDFFKKIACAGAVAACAVTCASGIGTPACAACFSALGASSCIECI